MLPPCSPDRMTGAPSAVRDSVARQGGTRQYPGVMVSFLHTVSDFGTSTSRALDPGRRACALHLVVGFSSFVVGGHQGGFHSRKLFPYHCNNSGLVAPCPGLLWAGLGDSQL